eukprot:13679767-Alexandrium_andersonii.AAC.1
MVRAPATGSWSSPICGMGGGGGPGGGAGAAAALFGSVVEGPGPAWTEAPGGSHAQGSAAVGSSD